MVTAADRSWLRATVDEEVEQRLMAGGARLRPQDWKSGDRLWIVDIMAPFGADTEMIADLKAKVFADREIKVLAIGAGGKGETRVV